MEQDHDSILSPSSLKQKLKHSLPLSFCFTKSRPHHHHEPQPRLTRTSSGSAPRIKFKYRNFISHTFGGGGGGGPKHARRHSYTDFSYNAMSYALNFDEGGDDKDSEESPLRNFTSRLPRSPVGEYQCVVID
ncbi:hypothetical protein Ddye_021886 [Dipteronia dyeriana]|uniref:Uncharacterized protein n=1 Tax=Dipteronia dyeriana TaxID=168575 RepID=A0AAD9U2I4_9ROSI|nr:hypothetical protein Ddye_021886 [Dipteronia dyeriana]